MEHFAELLKQTNEALQEVSDSRSHLEDLEQILIGLQRVGSVAEEDARKKAAEQLSATRLAGRLRLLVQEMHVLGKATAQAWTVLTSGIETGDEISLRHKLKQAGWLGHDAAAQAAEVAQADWDRH